MGESSAPRRPTHDTNTSRREVKITHTHKTQIHHENHWIDCIYHAASYGFSTFWSFSFPENDEIYKEQVLEELLRYQVEGPFLRQDVPAPRGRKLALIPLADLAD